MLLFGDLSIFVLGDVDLVNLLNDFFALPILASDLVAIDSGGATLPSPETCDPVDIVITVASAELAPANDPGDD